MEFNLVEKLAVVKAVNEVILADGHVDEGEMGYLVQLMNVLDFDMEFVKEAMRLNAQEGIAILRGMSSLKKKRLAFILHEMASADGVVDDAEKRVLVSFFLMLDIDMAHPERMEASFDVSDIYFESSDHIRYQNGVKVSGPHGGARRAVQVEPNIHGNRGYSVTIYNLDGNHPVWGNNVQMAPKPMEVVDKSDNSIELRGYGTDPRAMGDPVGRFSNYGLTIYHDTRDVEKIVLHMHDRGVDIEYLK